MQLLAVAVDDEERVVDADAEADHDRHELREVGHLDRVGHDGDGARPDADPDERRADRHAHRQHRAERDDQDDDGEREAERLGVRGFEGREDLASELDAEPLDLGEHVEDLLAHRQRVVLVDVVGELDVGVGDRAVGRDAGRADLAAVGADHGGVGQLVDGGEQLLHRRLHLGIGDALLRGEHDRPADPGAHAAEVLIDDLDAPLGLDVGRAELGGEPGADGTAHRAHHHQRQQPDPEHPPPVVEARPPETGEEGFARERRRGASAGAVGAAGQHVRQSAER